MPQVRYKDPVSLVEHLRSMAESNALLQRRSTLSPDTALAAAATYTALFGEERDGQPDPDAGVPASYQIIYMTGWAPHESQQKSAPRGSATVSFEDLAAAMAAADGKEGGSAGEPGTPAAPKPQRIF